MTSIIGQDACSNCKFFYVDGANAKVCRRYPPTVQAIVPLTPDGPRHMGDVSMPPRVQLDGWCGEHVRRKIAYVEPGQGTGDANS